MQTQHTCVKVPQTIFENNLLARTFDQFTIFFIELKQMKSLFSLVIPAFDFNTDKFDN